MDDLPLLFVDHPFPDSYRDLVDGRAAICGSGTDEGLDRANGVIAGATRPWDAAAFASAPRLTVISRVGVGFDNVNVADADAAGVTVCNTPTAPTVSTAEHTMALMFAVTKHLPHQIERARGGLGGEPVGRSLELDDRVLGLVGIGRIASRVAVAAQALGMRVIATDPGVDSSPVPGVELVDLAELLTRSDVVSLHAPALPSTAAMINADTLAAMKPGAYLVNCARGTLVDHARTARLARSRPSRRRRARRHRSRAPSRRASAARSPERRGHTAHRLGDRCRSPSPVRALDRERPRCTRRPTGDHCRPIRGRERLDP